MTRDGFFTLIAISLYVAMIVAWWTVSTIALIAACDYIRIDSSMAIFIVLFGPIVIPLIFIRWCGHD